MSEHAELWKTLGGAGDIPPLAGVYAGKDLLILGCAPCIWADLEAIGDDAWPGDRMPVNWIGCFYEGRILHWASLHDELFKLWEKYRTSVIDPDNLLRLHSFRNRDETQGLNVWPLPNKGGGSGLFAILIGLLMGYDRIVLAGMPMDNSGYFCASPKSKRILRTPYGTDLAIKRVWAEAMPLLEGRVTSLSGNTRDWLGAPSFAKASPFAEATGDKSEGKAK